MANPEGAKAGEPYQNLDEEGLRRSQLSLIPMSGGGLVVGRYPSLGCQGGGGVVVAIPFASFGKEERW